eukprot:1158956-Pelagomonas_calceolata.AAC.6
MNDVWIMHFPCTCISVNLRYRQSPLGAALSQTSQKSRNAWRVLCGPWRRRAGEAGGVGVSASVKLLCFTLGQPWGIT